MQLAVCAEVRTEPPARDDLWAPGGKCRGALSVLNSMGALLRQAPAETPESGPPADTEQRGGGMAVVRLALQPALGRAPAHDTAANASLAPWS